MATVSSKDYREFIEEKEKEYLSPYAALSVNTRGRERPMKPCPHGLHSGQGQDNTLQILQAAQA